LVQDLHSFGEQVTLLESTAGHCLRQNRERGIREEGYSGMVRLWQL